MRQELKTRLAQHGVSATSQRLDVAEILFVRPQHMSADQVIGELRANARNVSKATVYNTLNMFVEHGLLRELHVDPERTFYDSTTRAHHHFYNMDTGELIDIPSDHVVIDRLPELPAGTVSQGIDVVVRVRNARPD